MKSEHHYQFKKLKAHNKGEEAYLLVAEETGFKAMKRAQSMLPDAEVSDEWKSSVKDEMLETCCLKFSSYEHVRECLLESRITLAEAMKDPFWGTGLTVQQTHECLPDFWPGQNTMGYILMDVRSELQAAEDKKQKASSLLESDQVKVVKA